MASTWTIARSAENSVAGADAGRGDGTRCWLHSISPATSTMMPAATAGKSGRERPRLGADAGVGCSAARGSVMAT